MKHYPYALLSVALMAWWSDAYAARPHRAATAITEAAQADASYAYSQRWWRKDRSWASSFSTLVTGR